MLINIFSNLRIKYFPKVYIRVKCLKLETHFPTEMLLQTVVNSQSSQVKLIKLIISNIDIFSENSVKLYYENKLPFKFKR